MLAEREPWTTKVRESADGKTQICGQHLRGVETEIDVTKPNEAAKEKVSSR